MRVRAIDAFRGAAIALMVFFSLALNLSAGLPDLLKHNQPDEISPGDFVLPMFLFASGMSLVFFVKKRENAPAAACWMDIIGRSGKLLLVWVFLSLFSSGEILGMDELALSVILSLAAILLIPLPAAEIATIALAPPFAYIVLLHAGMLPDFSGHYLGGFAALPFYLPVMLAGAIAGRDMKGTWKVAAGAAILSAILLFIIPPYKTDASPSFMALSVLLSALAFMGIERLGAPWAEYMGKRPLRFWILMYVLLIIPLVLYALASRTGLPLGLPWPAAIIVSACAIPLLVAASKGMDMLEKRISAAKA